MSRKVLIFLAYVLLAMAVSPAFLRAQGGPPPGPPPFGGRGGFGRGRGFRVVGVEGCLTSGRPVPSGTPGYAATIVLNRTEATFSGSTNHSSTEYSYRDNNGVYYTELTLPAIGSSQTPRTVICITDPNLHVRLVVNPANSTAREFKLPTPKSFSNGGQSPQQGKSQTPPANPNVTISHSTTLPPGLPSAVASALSSEITNDCGNVAQTTLITRTTPSGPATSERVYCPSLFLELYSQNSDPRGISTSTATITAISNQVSPPVPYPLPSNYAVTVVTPGQHGKRGQGSGGTQ